MIIDLQPFASKDFATMAKSVATDNSGTKRMAWYTDAQQWAQESAGSRRGALKAVSPKGQALGFIDVELTGASGATFALYILPEVRGKRLASDVLEAFKLWSAQHDVVVLTAYVEADNAASRKVLERSNFLPDGIRDDLIAYHTRVWA